MTLTADTAAPILTDALRESLARAQRQGSEIAAGFLVRVKQVARPDQIAEAERLIEQGDAA